MNRFAWLFFVLLPLAAINAEEPEASPAPASSPEAAISETASEEPVAAEPEATASHDESVPAPPTEPAAPAAPAFVVVIPEQIDNDWFWMMFGGRSQNIVQNAIEKALIRAGLDVVDLAAVQELPSVGNDPSTAQSLNYALSVGRQVNADYVISGMATAVKSSEGTAYNVNVVRTQAEINAKIVRIHDGKIMAIEDASALDGGQSSQAAGQNALKKAGTVIASKLAREAREIASAKPATAQ